VERSAADTGREEPEDGDVCQLLVLVNEEIAGDAVQAVAEEVRRAAGDRTPAVHLVCPPLASSMVKHQMGDVDEAMGPARERLDASLKALEGAGIRATGEVGDADPVMSVSDELSKFPDVERIIVIAHARDDEAAYAEKELLERIDREFEPPATELLVSGHGSSEHVEERLTAKAGASRAEEGRRISGNLPPFRTLDTLGIIVAIVGTIVLFILAGACEEAHHEQGDNFAQFEGGCALRYLIAGGFFLINLAHVGALLLMESINYHGPFERFFARMSLIGTPVAVLVSALISG